ncbi:MAG: ribbon-helix-helix domain-containing protein [Methyloceanibacter sp.]|uniref:ribbon-helix-helix domain-containing protein n=1 Tax=Methyloceanibacter sp. TaxID=1965321 RepID=UPI003D6CE959
MSAPSRTVSARRKLIEFAPHIWQALEVLAIDSGRSVQSLADEAFSDILHKYHRPTSLKEALRESARRLPANDDLPPERHGT